MSSINPPVQLGPTYGALLLAAFVAVALWGMTCTQTLIYFIRYPNDRPLLKSLVMWLWLANTAHEILIVKGVYDCLIVHFCDYNWILTVVPEFLWQALLTVDISAITFLSIFTSVQCLVCVTSQTFFTYRIWRFAGNGRLYWAILVPVCLFELAGTLTIIALGVITPSAAEFVTHVPLSIYIAIHAVAAVADLAIAAGMIVLLCQSQERALKGSRSIIHRLLVLTINTGIWTALFAVFALVSILALQKTLIYVAVYFPLCPVYCNTVLANLNAREFLRNGAESGSGTIENAYQLGPVFASQGNTVRGRSMDPRLTVRIEVDKSVRIEDDEPALRVRGNKVDFGNE